MGWHHNWNPQKRRYEWFPMEQVLKYDFQCRKGIPRMKYLLLLHVASAR